MTEKTTRNAMSYILARDGVVHSEAIEAIERLDREVDDLLDCIDEHCRAMTVSIQVSGNDAESNLSWVKRLRALFESKKATL